MPNISHKRIEQFIAPFRVEPGKKVRLPRDFDSAGMRGHYERSPKEVLREGIELLAEYQARLAAQDTYGVLVVLQAMDAAGKDGTIRHVMSGVNPQGVEVHSFKVPSSEELDHDYLWRYARRLPERGHIGIFNRSYYEEVLVVRVHRELLLKEKLPSAGEGIWKRRFREINDWERYLTDQGYRIVKLFLNLSRDEQRRRFLERIDEPDKNWKFSSADARERTYWDDYQAAFSEVLSKTSTEWAPWWVVPADDKPFARVAAAGVLAHTLMEIDPHYPKITGEVREGLDLAKAELEGEVPSLVAQQPEGGHNGHAGSVAGAAAVEVEVRERTGGKRSKSKKGRSDKTGRKAKREADAGEPQERGSEPAKEGTLEPEVALEAQLQNVN